MPQAPDSRRPLIAGPSEGPADPFPIRLSGPIVKGFGRGSADLGIPTANIPLEGLSVGGHENVESGIYFGWCGINVDNDGNAQHPTADDRTAKPNATIWQMVMSIGWNPFYGNKIRSVVCLRSHDSLTCREVNSSHKSAVYRKSTSCSSSSMTSTERA